MASRASIAGHPLHPILIPFPIGLLVFSFIADLIYLWRGNPILGELHRVVHAAGRNHRDAGGGNSRIHRLADVNVSPGRARCKLACAREHHHAGDLCREFLSAHHEWDGMDPNDADAAVHSFGRRDNWTDDRRMVGRRAGIQARRGSGHVSPGNAREAGSATTHSRGIEMNQP